METVNGHESIIQRLKEQLKARQTYTILVIDDDHYFNSLIIEKIKLAAEKIRMMLGKEVEVLSYTNGEDFLRHLHCKKFDKSNLLVFLDYYLGDNLNGLFILNRLMFLDTNPVVFILSDRPDQQLAREVKSAGALLYMQKNSYSPDICQLFLEELII